MLRWILFSIAILIAYGPLLLQHGLQLWHKEHFQFYPVYLIAVAAVLKQRFREAELPEPGKWKVEPISMGLAVPLLVMALWAWSPWLAAVSFVLLGDSLLCHLHQVRQCWRLLALLIPLPLGFDGQLIQKLQLMSSVRASQVLDFLHVPHVMQGNVLQLSDKSLFVEEACSGINSVYLLIAATLLYIVLTRERFVRSLPLLISVAWWALIANVFRIVVIAAAHDRYQLDLTSGWKHDVLGLATMFLAMFGIASTKSLLDFLTDAVRVKKTSTVAPTSFLTPTVLWNIITARLRPQDVVLGGFGFHVTVSRRRCFSTLSVLLLSAFSTYWGVVTVAAMQPKNASNADRQQPQLTDLQVEQFQSLQESTFSRLSEFQVETFEVQSIAVAGSAANDGVHSKFWQFKSTAVSGRVSVEGPFDRWNDLRDEYRQQGWNIEQTSTYPIRGQQPRDQLVAVTMTDEQGHRKRLYFCEFYTTGDIAPSPLTNSSDLLAARLKERINDVSNSETGITLWRLQLTTDQSSGLSMEPELQAERKLFASIFAILQQYWKQR